MAGGIITPSPSTPATPARFTGTRTFYSAASSGGSATTLNTVVITGGYVNSWTQSTAGAGVPGEWQFNDQVNSGQIITIRL